MAFAPAHWPTVWRSQRFPPRGVLLLLLALIVAAAAVWGYVNGLFGQRQSTAPVYQTAPVARGNLVSSIAATGPISSPSSLPLTFKSSGKLLELLIKVGDRVAAGQVLARLDTTDLEAQVAQAQATLAQNQANYDKLAAGATAEAVGAA